MEIGYAMPRITSFIAITVPLIIIIMVAMLAHGQNDTLEYSASNRLVLNIYLDKAGDAFVTGYADNLGNLKSLNTSMYKYNNKTKELFFRTNDLTRKEKSLWTLRFDSFGRHDGYYVAFYLPADVKIKNVNISKGLGHLVSVNNDSLLVEVQGYEVYDPSVTIEYQQPITNADKSGNSPNAYLYTIFAVVILCLGLAIVIMTRQRSAPKSVLISHNDYANEPKDVAQAGGFNDSFEPFAINPDRLLDIHTVQQTPKPEEDSSSIMESSLFGTQLAGSSLERIEITGEIRAMMDSLTERERVILKVLLDNGGSMTQAGLRNKIDIPKSTLSGALISLEKRKLITKKEYGRTNAIALSEAFFSKKGPS